MSMALQYLFAEPEYVDGIDENNPIAIYPVKAKDYDLFQMYSQVLHLSKNHFAETPCPLLILVLLSHELLGIKEEELKLNFCNLFSLVLQKEVNFISIEEGFLIGKDNIISHHNYDKIREIIMRQNLMFEQKIYKTKLMNQWAEKALKAKQKGAAKVSFEDIVSTVSVGCHKHYDDLKNYTIYQIFSDFYRYRKIEEHRSNIQYRAAGADITLQDYAEDLSADLYHNPYDDLFVSSDKLTGLNKAIKK
jgi:hypothetical protein